MMFTVNWNGNVKGKMPHYLSQADSTLQRQCDIDCHPRRRDMLKCTCVSRSDVFSTIVSEPKSGCCPSCVLNHSIRWSRGFRADFHHLCKGIDGFSPWYSLESRSQCSCCFQSPLLPLKISSPAVALAGTDLAG